MTPPTDTDAGGHGQPISFRARPELADQLADRDARRGTAARRDLTRYYALLEEELAGVQLDEDLADQVLLGLHELAQQPGGPRSWSGTAGLPSHRWLSAELERAASAEAAAAAREWTPVQARAVLDAVERAWRRLKSNPTKRQRQAALRAVGLLRRP